MSEARVYITDKTEGFTPESVSMTPEPDSSATGSTEEGKAALDSAGSPASEAIQPPTGYFLKPDIPLTSFSSTPQNIACISFVLGLLFSAGLILSVSSLVFGGRYFIWRTTDTLPEPKFFRSLFSPVLGSYLSFWALFHLLEFVVTAMYNPGKLSVSSFLINNGNAFYIAHAFALSEYILTETFAPSRLRLWKHSGVVVLIGYVVLAIGQVVRSLAMITASSNFSHIVAKSKVAQHQLVTTGIYSWSRHPSYAGFVWWALGMQLILCNPLSFAAYVYVLHMFFSYRIFSEEKYLVSFFGDEYIQYKKRVPTRVPFIY